MGNQLGLRELLHNQLLQKKKKNSAYSVRAFARQTGISPGSLSEILRGKRNISYRLAVKIIENLTIPPDETKKILSEFSKKQQKLKRNYTELDMDKYYLIADWFHFAILSLLETSDFKNDNNWISERLNITKREANSAIKRLIRLKLIKKENGNLKLTRESFITSDGVLNILLRKSHFQNLELAHTSLEQDDVTRRDFSSITMAIDPQKLPVAIKKIRKFYNELSQVLEAGQKTEVYRFCGQLFPLTTNNRSNK